LTKKRRVGNLISV